MGAKLIEYTVSARLKAMTNAANRLRVEIEVLLEYYEEFKLNRRAVEYNLIK